MSDSRIIRLRGDGPPLVWPGALEALVSRSADLRQRRIRLVSADEAMRVPGRYRPLSEWEATIDEAHSDAAEVFGGAQGWTSARRGSPRLLLSPPERRRTPRGLPAWARRDDVFEHPDFYRVG